MLNFRRVKQDFSSNLLKEGKNLYNDNIIIQAKLASLDSEKIKLLASVKGPYENTYDCELEIDRSESEIIDSNCDCPHDFDCQHLAALLFYLETHMDRMVVEFSNHAGESLADASLQEEIEKAKSKHEAQEEENLEKELLDEYIRASKVLTSSPFFLPEKKLESEKVQIGILITSEIEPNKPNENVELQLSLRMAFRTKPLIVPDSSVFLKGIRQKECQTLQDRPFLFTPDSFDPKARALVEFLVNHSFSDKNKNPRTIMLSKEDFGEFLSICYQQAVTPSSNILAEDGQAIQLSYLNYLHTDSSIDFYSKRASLVFNLEYIKPPTNKLLAVPKIACGDRVFDPSEVCILNGAHPGFIAEGTYYRFQDVIRRVHLESLDEIVSMAIPEPLFGTFVENSMPELSRFAQIKGKEVLDEFITLPYTQDVTGRCKITYVNGEMDAEFWFKYDDYEIPSAHSQLSVQNLQPFHTKDGIVARCLIEEKNMIEELFQGFYFDETTGKYIAKTEKKIVDFMTQSLPKFKDIVQFDCPENLLDQFRYDETRFKLRFDVSKHVGSFQMELVIDGDLTGVKMDLLWDCIASKKKFIEMNLQKTKTKNTTQKGKFLVLNLERLSPIVQLLDEIGVDALENFTSEKPLWNLIHLTEDRFLGLDIEVEITDGLQQIQKEMLSTEPLEQATVPSNIKADLRSYQKEGVAWLGRLRSMHLGGVLADDMGLGKTLQAICAVSTVLGQEKNGQVLIVCPTSLTYNWMEEFHKFCPEITVQVVDGPPNKRAQLLKDSKEVDVFVTSYTLLQKDVNIYKKTNFSYVILDEAQHIKNRATRNAKSVKQLQAKHRLVLTGTPIENSLEDLWSLFDFLMPSFLGTFDRFTDKYVRASASLKDNLETLKRKIFPFILRRMKQDVLKDLPPISHISYQCQLTDVQQELYSSYAKNAKAELSKLVQKEGFDKIRIHVLATLTRLKQICCHPAIFAKEKAERGDSAKYEMLLEMLPGFAANRSKTVVFSQYTKMLQIMKQDLEEMQVPFVYLDGSSKNRLEIVKSFNEDPDVFVFLISLKAGGVGLNLTSAENVIHYDMWWNPAVENQATDRVHRLGQKKKVSSYKLLTRNTIEEKIQAMQDSKKGLVKKLISTDEEVISKLTWEEVLDLLKT